MLKSILSPHNTSSRSTTAKVFKMASALASAQPQSVFPKSHVGFDSITTQIEKKLLKRGFQFNVICVGMSKSMFTPGDERAHAIG